MHLVVGHIGSFCCRNTKNNSFLTCSLIFDQHWQNDKPLLELMKYLLSVVASLVKYVPGGNEI